MEPRGLCAHGLVLGNAQDCKSHGFCEILPVAFCMALVYNFAIGAPVGFEFFVGNTTVMFLSRATGEQVQGTEPRQDVHEIDG